MLITCYNPAQLGDVLLVVLGQSKAKQLLKEKKQIVEIADSVTGQIVGYNFFNASAILKNLKQKKGQVFLQQTELNRLNEALLQAGFKTKLALDATAKFVIGHVDECVSHPNSNHLHITQVDIGDKQKLQIVCGAPNIAAGQTVIVAKVGAMMPNGEIIWPGILRGVASNGMICSARELALPHAPQKRGILVLPSDKYRIGSTFNLKKERSES
jgi:tRNA-binding protein